ncbi:MAG: Cof-type HAD-IIB family hydrolase [Oscillospiraceae bacterium]|nr:Cof-type HAD-IIB family hydrolase [Oscillospiraceae bacterium]
MPNYKIIASDLDGTLLRDDKTISQENLDAIKKFTEMGGIFVPTTGRAIGEVPDFLLNNPDIRYIICSDGTGIYDKQTGRCEFDAIPHDLLMRAVDTFLSYDTHIVMHYNNAAYSDTNAELFNKEQMEHLGELNPHFAHYAFSTYKPNFREFCASIGDAELLFAFFWDLSELEECAKRLEEMGEFSVLSSADRSIEIIRKTSDKGYALLRLADMLGIDKSETIAVGDNTNDHNLIECAGLGLAMGNAVPSLKELADSVICTNAEHNVDYIVKNFIK